MNHLQSNPLTPIIRLRNLTLVAAVLTYALIVMGGIVRVTGSSLACPDWPTCYGQLLPPESQNALINYTHRILAFLTFSTILIATGYTWKKIRGYSLITWLITASMTAVGIQISLGAIFAYQGIWNKMLWLSSLHLGLSLFIQACLNAVIVLTFWYAQQAQQNPGRLTATSTIPNPIHLSIRKPFVWVSVLVLIGIFMLLSSGSLIAASHSAQVCTTWLFCNEKIVFTDTSLWINLLHRIIVAAIAVLLGLLLVRAWQKQSNQTTVLVATIVVAVLFYSQALLGAKLTASYPNYLRVLHQATAIAVWAIMVVQVIALGLVVDANYEEKTESIHLANLGNLVKDLFLLTKPIVVALLLVTTYAGMVIAGGALPSLGLTFWTLLGGFLAAGGSGAINQYIDRYDDLKMQRTQKRPIPAGRLTPAQGLAFGVAMTLISFYLMVAFVNLLAALLTLAGIIYYVLIYSIFLKKTTVQNIVIGGGAGAIPPLVGWAAVTGSLNVPALFLFAIVFLWTPPHFWALALVRRKDYARAGVPMLPVVRGEKETRWQIFLYTAELVALTLFLPLFSLGGSITFVGAIVLGGWLLLSAWKVWQKGGNKLAWKMYRYSSMYLAFLFIVLIIDSLI